MYKNKIPFTLLLWLAALLIPVIPGTLFSQQNDLPPVEATQSPIPESQATPTESISLKINLPATRLDLYVNGKLEQSYPVAIGMPKYPTPIRDFAISHINWNPWWLPPDSPWAEGAEKTPPGPRNPLGPVKLIMENGIRIHGTNAPSSIGRAASHACLRMRGDDIVELAWRIQQAYSLKRDAELKETYRKNRRSTYWVNLFETVPVSMSYTLVERQGDKLLIHPDRYGRGGLEKELQAVLADHPQISINKALLKKVKEARRKGTAEVSLAELTEWSQGEAPANGITSAENQAGGPHL